VGRKNLRLEGIQSGRNERDWKDDEGIFKR
jgi:hypothetical protein